MRNGKMLLKTTSREDYRDFKVLLKGKRLAQSTELLDPEDGKMCVTIEK